MSEYTAKSGLPARPLRAVVSSEIRAGRGGLLGGDTSRRKFWWRLVLDCGHKVDRDVRYQALASGELPIRGGRTNRPAVDRLPPPTRARCDTCILPPERTQP